MAKKTKMKDIHKLDKDDLKKIRSDIKAGSKALTKLGKAYKKLENFQHKDASEGTAELAEAIKAEQKRFLDLGLDAVFAGSWTQFSNK